MIDVGDDIIVVVAVYDLVRHEKVPRCVSMVRGIAISVGQRKVSYLTKRAGDVIGGVWFADRSRVFSDSGEIIEASGCAGDLAVELGVSVVQGRR
jgi:hypothetical protein